MGNAIAIARFEARRAKTIEFVRKRQKSRRATDAKKKLEPQRTGLRPSGEGVYVLKERGTNLVKIGCTENFRRRYGSLVRSDNPRALEFLGWLSRDLSEEGRYHAEFQQFRAKGGGGIEWFELSDDQIEALSARLSK